ncbi:MAG TPA: TNT domain-containing protein [Kofleriaceae bacterium]|nr:TNT domain-containing protein [Kofleriaceae bacterium]
MLILVGALALAATAGVKVVVGSLAQRTECAGEQIQTLSLVSPCGGGGAGDGNNAPIFASVSEQPAPRSRSIGGGRFALPRPEPAGFVLASTRTEESATEVGPETVDPTTAQDELVDLLTDVIGVKDAIKCLTEVDVVACAITVANFTPLRVVKLASSLNKIRRAVDRLRAARRIKERADSARKPSRELEPFFPPNRGFLGQTRREFLQPGQRIDRLGGSGFSRFFSPQGTPPSSRALPPGTAGQPLRTFEVLKPLEVEAGTVAPAFGQPGGGTQFLTPVRLEILIKRGFLREIVP